MAPRSPTASLWSLARSQHGVIARHQLLEYGLSPEAIRHRLREGRLHQVHRGIYAVGRPDLTSHGLWMAAVLGGGAGAALSHVSAAELWEIRAIRGGRVRRPIDISSPRNRTIERSGIRCHRRSLDRRRDITRRKGIPVTTPKQTLVDLAGCLSSPQLEAAVNAADKLDLVAPDALRLALDTEPRRPGLAVLRRVLDRGSFVLTDSELERRFLPIARRAGLPLPETGVRVNGFKVDFYWRDLGLVIETDGLRYHRTPSQQAKDRRRDQVHTAAGLVALRFTHDQVTRDAAYVERTLRNVLRRLVAAG